MLRYVYVENNKILETYDNIPGSWKNISGFNLLSDEARALLGFKKVKQEKVEIYDTALFDLKIDSFINDLGEVIYKETLVSKYTEAELIAVRKNLLLIKVRDQRNYLLNQTDWAVMPDVILAKNEKWKIAYYTYRQSLRDITNNLPNEYSDVQWPILEL